MWVEAILTRDDLARLLHELCPLTIALDPTSGGQQYLKLLNPKDVALVEGRGLRVTCEAELHWPVLGIDAPVRIPSLTMLLSVGLEPALDEEVLAFKPELESMDIAWVPNLIDGALTDKINRELDQRRVELSWHFFQTLSHVFELPSLLSPAAALDLKVAWGKVRVTPEAMVVAISFHTRVLQTTAAERALSSPPSAPPLPARTAPPASLAPAKANGVTVPVPVAIAGAAALLGVAAYAAFGASHRSWR